MREKPPSPDRRPHLPREATIPSSLFPNPYSLDPFLLFADRYPPESRAALTHQRARWEATRPLAGLTVLDATPLFRNTLLKHACLRSAGAEVWVGYGRTMPHDPAVAVHLADFGLRVPDATRLAQGFDVVLDCAGAFADVPIRLGRAELTRSGAARYAHCPDPVFLADAGRIKTFETALGTGDGLVRGLAHVGFGPLRGKRAIVFGCGKVGRGILFRLMREGAETIAVDCADVRPPRGTALVPLSDRAAVERLLAHADVVVTATGVRHALAGKVSPAALIRSPAALANMGVEDEFGPDVPAARVLNRKAPLNFLLGDPTQMRYIDPTMALHNAAVGHLLAGHLTPGLNVPAPDDESPILATLPPSLMAELEAFEAANR